MVCLRPDFPLDGETERQDGLTLVVPISQKRDRGQWAYARVHTPIGALCWGTLAVRSLTVIVRWGTLIAGLLRVIARLLTMVAPGCDSCGVRGWFLRLGQRLRTQAGRRVGRRQQSRPPISQKRDMGHSAACFVGFAFVFGSCDVQCDSISTVPLDPVFVVTHSSIQMKMERTKSNDGLAFAVSRP
jgi:hypothetical protein